MNILYIDHRDSAKDNACSIYRRLRDSVPSVKLFVKNEYFSDGIPLDYDTYFIHLSSTSVDAVEELKKNNPSAFVVGMSDMYLADREVPSILSGLLDVYAERSASEDNLERLSGLLKSRIQ